MTGLDSLTEVARPLAQLEVTDQQGRKKVPLDKPRLTVGRRAENDLCLAGSDVSRDHAEIVSDSPRIFRVRDRGSRFGTFVNGEQVTEHTLRHGDEIRFGRSGSATAVFLLEEGSHIDASSTSVVTAGLRQVTTLLDGLRALGSGRVLDEVLALVIDSAISLAGAERGFVMLAQPSGPLEFMLGRSHHGKTLPGTRFETSRKIPEEVFTRGEARVVKNLPEGDLENAHLQTRQLGIRHVVCVPLSLTPFGQQEAPREPRKIGVLYLDSQKEGQLLSPDTLQAIETLATEASVAIEHARLYREAVEKAQIDRELKIAGEIQRMLVPARQRSTASIEAAGMTIPCRAIGGDFFDLYDLPDGGFGFAVADISGKGVPAALLAAALQGAFAAYATAGPSPAEAIIVGNTVLYGRFEGRFATMFYGIVTPDGRFAYCNAGHNPPLLIKANGEMCKLDIGGRVLGLFADNQYEEGHVSLEPGDLIVLFSDGLPEANDPQDNEFGDERIETLVAQNAKLAPSALLDRMLQEVGQFSAGAPPRDDLTIFVLRYRGQGAPA